MSRARRAAVVAGTALLALACGIAIGVGPLSGDDEEKPLQTGDGSRDRQAPDEFLATFAADGGAALADSGLESADALVVTLPGAADAAASGVADSLDEAGANVTGSIAVQPKLLSASNRQFATEVAEQSAKIDDDDLEDYALIGRALAIGYVSTDPEEMDDRQGTIATAFTDAGLIASTEAPEKTSDLVVFVSGPHAPDGATDILGEFVNQIEDKSEGIVVSGPRDASEDAYVSAIRESELEVSTFDEVDSPAGQAVVPLVAIHETKGQSGSYGSDDAEDGPYPR